VCSGFERFRLLNSATPRVQRRCSNTVWLLFAELKLRLSLLSHKQNTNHNGPSYDSSTRLITQPRLPTNCTK
jgi:hypothetical protein